MDAKTRILEFIADARDRLAPFKFHVGALVAALVLGAAVGVFKTTKSPPTLADTDRWNLPTWKPVSAAPLRTVLAAEPLFMQDPIKKKAASDALAAAAVPIWRFTGTVREGGKNIALIEVDKGKRIKKIVPGDELPGGAKVTAVQVGALIYTDGSDERVLRLFNPTKDAPETAKKSKN